MLPIKGNPFGPGGYGALLRNFDAKFSSRNKVSGRTKNRVVWNCPSVGKSMLTCGFLFLVSLIGFWIEYREWRFLLITWYERNECVVVG